ncbi:MAG: LysM domain-containing protein [Dehalococcoidia bacterium]
MRCFQCDNEATQECPRCGALYCDAHGDALCERCMDPALALPSYRVYRGSVLALLVGSVVAVWLLVLPPAGADQDGPPGALSGLVNTPTAVATETPTATATAEPTETPAETGTPEATEEPDDTPTATPEPTEPPAEQTYTVQPGDTLFAIAERFAPPGADLSAYADRLATVNNLADSASLSIGQVLIIPAE